MKTRMHLSYSKSDNNVSNQSFDNQHFSSDNIYQTWLEYLFWARNGKIYDNTYPMFVEAVLRKLPIGSIIEKMTEILEGRGLTFGFNGKFDDDAKEKALKNESFKNFWYNSKTWLQPYISTLIMNYLKYENVFPKLHFDSKNKVAKMSIINSMYYRLDKYLPENNNELTRCYSYNYWDNFLYQGELGCLPSKSQMFENPLLCVNDYLDVEQVYQRKGDNNYIILFSKKNDGLQGYAQPAWHCIFDSDFGYWLDIVLNFAKEYRQQADNSAKPLSEIKMAYETFMARHPNLQNIASEQFDQAYKDALDEESEYYSEVLTGKKNYGAVLVSLYGKNQDGEDIGVSFDYKKIPTDAMSEMDLRMNEAAQFQILNAFGLPAQLFNVAMKEKLTAVAGSAVKEHWNIFCEQRSSTINNLVTQSFYVAGQINGWNGIDFKIDYGYIQPMSSITPDQRIIV